MKLFKRKKKDIGDLTQLSYDLKGEFKNNKKTHTDSDEEIADMTETAYF